MMSKILVVEDEHAIRLALRGPPCPWPARCLQLTDDDESNGLRPLLNCE